jgi:hypothetical protein
MHFMAAIAIVDGTRTTRPIGDGSTNPATFPHFFCEDQ